MIRLEIAEASADVKPGDDEWKVLHGEPPPCTMTIKTLRTGQVNPLNLSIDDARRVGGIKKRIERLLEKYENWMRISYRSGIILFRAGVNPTKAQKRRAMHVVRLIIKSSELQEKNK